MDYINNGVTKNSEALPNLDLDKEHYVKDHPNVIRDDYEELLLNEMYQISIYEAPGVPNEYEVSISTITYDDSVGDMYSEPLSDREQIYEDPGHIAEYIYAWFEEKVSQVKKG